MPDQRYVISYRNLPKRFPFAGLAAAALCIRIFELPDWYWNLWVASIVGFLVWRWWGGISEEVDIFGGDV